MALLGRLAFQQRDQGSEEAAVWATGQAEAREGNCPVQMPWGGCLSGMVKEWEASVAERNRTTGKNLRRDESQRGTRGPGVSWVKVWKQSPRTQAQGAAEHLRVLPARSVSACRKHLNSFISHASCSRRASDTPLPNSLQASVPLNTLLPLLRISFLSCFF